MPRLIEFSIPGVVVAGTPPQTLKIALIPTIHTNMVVVSTVNDMLPLLLNKLLESLLFNMFNHVLINLCSYIFGNFIIPLLKLFQTLYLTLR